MGLKFELEVCHLLLSLKTWKKAAVSASISVVGVQQRRPGRRILTMRCGRRPATQTIQ